jgi:protease-4
MRRNKILNYIQSQPWLIDSNYAGSVMPWVMANLEDGADPDEGLQREKAMPETNIPEQIGYIFASGVVGKYLGMSESGIDLRDLQSAIENTPYTHNVLHLDTPGGTVNGVYQTAKLIEKKRAEGKHFYAYTDTMACSAGYWIAAACDSIFMDYHASVGSIGVYSASIDQSKLYEREGIAVNVIASGKYKGAGAYNTALTDEQKDLFQKQIMALAQDFKSEMKRYRDIPDAAMEGQSFSGVEALESNICDYIVDSLSDVFAMVDKNKQGQV